MSVCIQLTCQTCKSRSVHTLKEDTDHVACSSCGRTTEIRLVPGFVYVLSNMGHKEGLYKVGYSERSVDERILELNSQTATPEPFTLEAAFPSDTPYEHEQQLHEALKEHRIPGKEYFRIDLKRLLSQCSTICKTSACMGREYSTDPVREDPTEPEITALEIKLKELEAKGRYQQCMVLARAFVKQRAMTPAVLKMKKRAGYYESCVDKKLGPPVPKKKILAPKRESPISPPRCSSSSRSLCDSTLAKPSVEYMQSILAASSEGPAHNSKIKNTPVTDAEKKYESHHLARKRRVSVFSKKWRWQEIAGRDEHD